MTNHADLSTTDQYSEPEHHLPSQYTSEDDGKNQQEKQSTVPEEPESHTAVHSHQGQQSESDEKTPIRIHANYLGLSVYNELTGETKKLF